MDQRDRETARAIARSYPKFQKQAKISAKQKDRAAKRVQKEQHADGAADIARRYSVFRMIDGKKWSLYCERNGRLLGTFLPDGPALGISNEGGMRTVADFEEALNLIRAAFPIPNLTVVTNRVTRR